MNRNHTLPNASSTSVVRPVRSKQAGATLVGYFGCQNSGRSTLINHAIGDATLIATVRRDPQVAVQLAWSSTPSGTIFGYDGSTVVFDVTRTPEVLERASRDEGGTLVRIERNFPGLLDCVPPLEIVDTPPLDPVRGTYEAAHAWLSQVDGCVIVLPASRGLGEHEMRLLDAWSEHPCPVAFVTAAASTLWLNEPDTLLEDGGVEGALQSRADGIKLELERRARLNPQLRPFADAAFVGSVCVGASQRHVPEAERHTLSLRVADWDRLMKWQRAIVPQQTTRGSAR